MSFIDQISPAYVGEERIGIQVDPSSLPLLAGNVITVNFDFAGCAPEGVVRPLKFHVQPAFGNGAEYQETIFDIFVPDSFAFQVRSAGQYLLVIRETNHNQWFGRAVIDVGGDSRNQRGRV